MARRVNFIEEINATKDTWKIKFRIIGLWCVDRSSASSLKMIFMDENEGQSYVGENFDVVSNEGHYRSCKHPFKLIFQKGTITTNKQLLEIPPYIYQFTTFEDILSGVANTNVLIDVIGEFIDIEMSQPESMPKKVVFGMRDQRSSLSAKTH
ncbi:hypothetical protein Lal_00002243, partial [Lupinus albus]